MATKNDNLPFFNYRLSDRVSAIASKKLVCGLLVTSCNSDIPMLYLHCLTKGL